MITQDNDRYRRLIENSNDIIYTLSREGVFTFASPAWTRQLGHLKTDVEGRPFTEFVHPDDLPHCFAFIQQVLESGEREEGLEYRVRHSDGRWLWHTTSASPVIDATGRVTGLDGIARDITDRKNAEDALRESEARYRSLTENLPIGVYRCTPGPEGRLLMTNRALHELFGVAPEKELSKLKIADFYQNPAGRAAFSEQLLARGHIQGLELPLKRADDTLIWASVTARVVHNDQGDVAWFDCTLENITERKNSEQALVESENRARLQREAVATLVLNEAVSRSEMPGAYKVITEVLGDTMAAARVGIWLLNDSNSELTCMMLFEAEGRVFSSGTVLKAGDLPRYFEAILKENRIYAADAQTDPRTNELTEHYLKPLGITSMLDAGIVIGGKLKGVVCIEHIGEKRSWHADEEAFASTAASLVAQVLVNAELRESNISLQAQLAFETLVSDISSILISLPAEKLEEGVNHALRLTGEFFKADRCFVLLFNEDKTHYSTTHEWCAPNIKSNKARNQSFPVKDTAWWCDKVLNNQYFYIEDVYEMPPEAAQDQADFMIEQIRSLLSVQLIIENRVIGVFGYETAYEKSSWSEDQAVLFTVITELISGALNKQMAREEILRLSRHDQLTGLYNRYQLTDELNKLDREEILPLSIIVADLNGLKLINDTHGHATGDEMLKKTAAVLRQACRSEDVVARFGSDEFVILLPRTQLKEALAFSRRVTRAFDSKQVEEMPLTISTGVAVKTGLHQDTRAVLREAEDNLNKNKLTESRSGKSAVVEALLKTLAEKSFETEAHTRNMQEIALSIGEKVGLPDSELNRLSLLITLHDIGKINIPGELLTKKGALTEPEWQIMKEHSETGYRIAQATEAFAHVAEDILSHHERWDGSGYPRGLQGEAIPLLARITALADAYEVMHNGRPYKQAMPHQAIITEIKACAGSHFDPQLTELTLEIIDGVQGSGV